MQRFQFKKEKNYDLVFVVIKNIYEVSNSFFSNIIYTYIDVCINTVVATIIAAYHQTNDEYMTGSFNERSRVTYKGALSLSLSLSLSHIHTLVLFPVALHFLLLLLFAMY
jgi:hypothetical protein